MDLIPITLRPLELSAAQDGRLTAIFRPVLPHPDLPILHVEDNGIARCADGAPYGPPYRTGETLWVREDFWAGRGSPKPMKYIRHRAVLPGVPDSRETFIWTPAEEMPQWACRLWFKVTKVDILTTRDITEEMAREALGYRCFPPKGINANLSRFEATYLAGVAAAWESQENAEGTYWDDNPQAFVFFLEAIPQPEGWPAVAAEAPA